MKIVVEFGAAELMVLRRRSSGVRRQHVVDLGAAKLICIFSWISGSHEKLGAAELLLGLEISAPVVVLGRRSLW